MSTSSVDRSGSTGRLAVSEVAVVRLTAAVHGAMVCFVLKVVVGHLAGRHLGLAGQAAVAGAFLTSAGALAVWSRPTGWRG